MPSVTLPNGEVHNFPDNAKPEDIKSALDGYTKQHPETLKPKQSSDSGSWRDTAIDFARPFADDAAAALGGTLGSVVGPVGTVAGGVGGYTLADQLLQHLKTNPPKSIGEGLINTGEQYALGKVGEKVIGAVAPRVVGLFKEFNNPGSVTKDIYGLNPTVSQSLKEGSLGQHFTKFVEDAFAPGSKKAAVAGSAQSGSDRFLDFARNLSGRSKSVLQNPEEYASKISLEGARNQFDALTKEASDNANKLKLFGNLNENPVMSGVDFETNQPTFHNLRAKGPVNLDNTRSVIDDFDRTMQGNVITERDNLIGTHNNKVKSAYDPIEFSNDNPRFKQVIYDAQGNPIGDMPSITSSGKRPIGIKDALEYRDTLDKFANKISPGSTFSNGKEVAPFFTDLRNALDKDIESSLGKWNNKGKEALDAFNNIKFLEDARKQVFEKSGLSELLNNPDVKQSTYINNILKDSSKLDRALQAGTVGLPNGTKLASSNIRNDLAGYRLSQLLQDNVVRDAQGQIVRINTQGLREGFNDPNFIEQNKKLFSKATRDSINDFIGALSRTQENTVGGSNKVWMTRRAIEIGSGLLLGHGLSGFGAGVIGAELGGGVLGKLMSTPKTAKIILAAAKGEPLNMSQQLAAKYINEVLQGMTMNVIDSSGKTTKATVTSNGLQPAQQ